MKQIIIPALLFYLLFVTSCVDKKLKEREIAVREKEVALKEKLLAQQTFEGTQNSNKSLQQNVNKNTNLSINSIIILAKKHFQEFRKILESRIDKVGVHHVYTGDFTGDPKEDVLIYYDLEPNDGGNYIAGQGFILYENTGDNAKFIIKYQPKFLFSFDKISNRKIYIIKEDFSDNDPLCCPSLHKKIELILNEGKIYEQ